MQSSRLSENNADNHVMQVYAIY